MDEQQQIERRLSRQQKRAVPFFAVLALLSVLAFILPLRPDRSVAEKRMLAEFPSWSAESFWNGSYFQEIGIWFSDTFPGREGYIRLAQGAEALEGLNRNRVLTDVVASREDELLDELLEAAETPEEPDSPAEAEAPAETAAPAPPAETEETGPGEESGTEQEAESAPASGTGVDAWEEVESWDGFNAEDEVAMYGSIVVLGDYVFAGLNFSQTASDQHAALCNKVGDRLAARGIRFFNLPIPTSVGVLVASDFLPQIHSADQGKILRYMFSQENDNVYKVNVFNILLAHNDEYIYFRGDHHWTALGAYYAYEEFCSVAGFEPVPLSEYQQVSMGDFLGTYYWKAGQSSRWTDELIAYLPPGDVSLYIPSYPRMNDPVWDLSDKDLSVKYNCFIGGDNEVTVLTNNDLEDGSTCMVVKDSFGNPFCIYLAQHYHQVVILDYRHVGQSLDAYLDEYQPQDFILAQSIGVSQKPEPQSLLQALFR